MAVAGVLKVIAPYVTRITGQLGVTVPVGERIVGVLAVRTEGRVAGVLAIKAIPTTSNVVTAPPVSVTGKSAGAYFGAVELSSLEPLKYEIRYALGDIAWELSGEFPVGAQIEQVAVTVAGHPITFAVVEADTSLTPSRQTVRVRALRSLEEALFAKYCLGESVPSGAASGFVAGLLAPLPTSWDVPDFRLEPEFAQDMLTFATKGEFLKYLAELVQAVIYYKPDGTLAVVDSAPDGTNPVDCLHPILELKIATIQPVETGGVYVATAAQTSNAFLKLVKVEDLSDELFPKLKLYIAAVPEPIIKDFKQHPKKPDLDLASGGSEVVEFEELAEFKSGVAQIDPGLVGYIRKKFNPTANTWTETEVPPVTLVEWLGDDLGTITARPNGMLFSSTIGDSIARLKVRRTTYIYWLYVVRGPVVVLPARLSWWKFMKEDITVTLYFEQEGTPSKLSLVLNTDTGRVEETPIIAPNPTLVPWVGQRHLRLQNRRPVEVTLAGDGMEYIGKVVNLGIHKAHIDQGTLNVDASRVTTRLTGTVVN